MRLYRYAIVYDTGSAPNYDPPYATLALCKPAIRRKAKEGDVVLAFCGATLGNEPHAVRWAGVVARRMTFAEYWGDSIFEAKKPSASVTPDNIYRPDEKGALVQVPNSVHGKEDVIRDTSGHHVLAFDPWWRFPSPSPVLPDEFEALRIYPPRQGHRVSEVDALTWDALRRWLEANVAPRAIETEDAGSSASPSCGPRKERLPAESSARRTRC